MPQVISNVIQHSLTCRETLQDRARNIIHEALDSPGWTLAVNTDKPHLQGRIRTESLANMSTLQLRQSARKNSRRLYRTGNEPSHHNTSWGAVSFQALGMS